MGSLLLIVLKTGQEYKRGSCIRLTLPGLTEKILPILFLIYFHLHMEPQSM